MAKNTNLPHCHKKIKIEEREDLKFSEVEVGDAGIKTEAEDSPAGAEPAKASNTGKILQFKITLLRGKGAPQIWRRFQVPSSYTFRQFHIAIQKAMGWKSVQFDYHLHGFRVVNPSTGEEDNITMYPEDLDPWQNPKDESDVFIKGYFTKAGQKGRYEYDFGISWEHEFVFEKEFEAVHGETYPRCVDGAKACPPEDGVVSSGDEYDSDEFDADACF